MKNLLLALPLLTAGFSSAATITANGTPTRTTNAPSIVMPSAAGTDWGLWGTNGASVPGGASITSSSGTQTFEVTTIGGAGTPVTRGSGSLAETRFNYSNGDPTISDTNLQVGGIFNSGGIGGATANLNSGVALSLTSIATPVRINLYTYIYESTARLNVYVGDAVDPAYTNTFTDDNNGKAGYIYTFDYDPGGTPASLRFEYVKTVSFHDNSNVGFTGISIVPEPSSVALLGAGAVAGLLRRKR